MTDWQRRIQAIGEATGPIPEETLVKPPNASSPPRLKTKSALFTKPQSVFQYEHDIFGAVRYTLLHNNDDYLAYLITTTNKETGDDDHQWTSVAWVFKRNCKHHRNLIGHHKLETPEIIIHTATGFTCPYVRRKPMLDYCLNGFKQHYGIEAYESL